MTSRARISVALLVVAAGCAEPPASDPCPDCVLAPARLGELLECEAVDVTAPVDPEALAGLPEGYEPAYPGLALATTRMARCEAASTPGGVLRDLSYVLTLVEVVPPQAMDGPGADYAVLEAFAPNALAAFVGGPATVDVHWQDQGPVRTVAAAADGRRIGEVDVVRTSRVATHPVAYRVHVPHEAGAVLAFDVQATERQEGPLPAIVSSPSAAPVGPATAALATSPITLWTPLETKA